MSRERLLLGDHLTLFGLFEGYGGLTEGVRQVTGGHLVGYAEFEPPSPKAPNPNQAAAKLLEQRFPGVPNVGDVSRADWSPWRGRVDVLTGGFPCQDVSVGGKRAGMVRGTRSGLWFEFARAIEEIAPALVLIENVPGLRTALAGVHYDDELEEELNDATDSDLERLDGRMAESFGRDRPVQRALGAVLGTLARLGYDTEWCSVRASDVGAPHRRERVFILAFDRRLAGIDDLRTVPDPGRG